MAIRHGHGVFQKKKKGGGWKKIKIPVDRGVGVL
jgi:hypothetical protein